MRASIRLTNIANSIFDKVIVDHKLNIDPLRKFTIRLGMGSHHRVRKSDLMKALKDAGAPDAWINKVDASRYDIYPLRGWATWIMDADADPKVLITMLADIYPNLDDPDATGGDDLSDW